MKGDVKRNIAPSTGSCPGLGVGIQPVQLERLLLALAYALGSSHKAMGCIPVVSSTEVTTSIDPESMHAERVVRCQP
jgi:hypothetical protein